MPDETQSAESNEAADFSSYITIFNKSSIRLENVQYGQNFGRYERNPPSNLAPGAMRTFQLKDKAGPAGTEGWTKYDAGEGVAQFNYQCGYSDDNYLTFDNAGTGLLVELYGNNRTNFRWKEDGSNWGREGQYPREGHPLSGLFVLSNG